MNILSLFDGMSCGRLALERAGFKIEKYYASEIDNHKIKASKNYFPDNIYIGDVKKVSGYDYDIDLLIGGSPCQGFSIMGDRLNFEDPRSGLIMDFFRILEEAKPKYFILENVPMDKQCEIEISKRLGVLPVKINSALVSAQNRKRLYWTNIPGMGFDLFGDEIEQPEDKKIMLKDILQPESEVDEKYFLKDKQLNSVLKSLREHKEKYVKLNGDKARCLLEGYSSKWQGTFICEINNKNVYFDTNSPLPCSFFETRSEEGKKQRRELSKKLGKDTTPRNKETKIYKTQLHGKANCLVTSVNFLHHIMTENLRIRKLTPIECCRLQAVPDNFFDGSGLSDNQIYSCLGDGWTVDVISHLLKGLK